MDSNEKSLFPNMLFTLALRAEQCLSMFFFLCVLSNIAGKEDIEE